MADELNIPTHRFYEPRNNITLSPNDMGKQWIYASGISKIDAWINAQPWGTSIVVSEWGAYIKVVSDATSYPIVSLSTDTSTIQITG